MIEMPWFYLEICSTQPTSNVVKMFDMFQSKKVQGQVDVVIASVVMDTEIAHREIVKKPFT